MPVKYLFCLLWIPFMTLPSWAQEGDSLAVVQQDWSQQRVKKGIVWKSALFDNLFGGKQAVNLIEIDLKKHIKNLKLAGVSQGVKLTSEFGKENAASVAINGGFFNTKTGGAVDYIKIDGNVINVSVNDHARSNAYFVFDKKSVRIIPRTEDTVQVISWDNVLLSGPLLLLDGDFATLDNSKFSENKHPRTAVALRGNTLILITIDGRNALSHGVSLPELSKFLRWYGCKEAMNLDGGGSTTMYVKGQTDDGVVNYPSDNKKFDHKGQRAVANVIYIKD